MVAININPKFSPEMLGRIRNNVGRTFPGAMQSNAGPLPATPQVASSLPPNLTFDPRTGEIIPTSPTTARIPIPANQPVTIDQPPELISTGFEQPTPLRAGGAVGESFFTGQQVPAIPVSTPSAPAAPPVIDPAQQAAINAVPTGLIGAEQSLLGGAEGSTVALLEALGVSRADIEAGGAGAQQRLEEARGGVAAGTQKSIEDILAGTTGVTTLEQGKAQGLEVLNRAFDAAVDPISGFIDPGRQAQTLQAALTGALGPEAQKAALTDFQTDPSIKFAVEEAERSLLRNTAAIGGLGGGNVRKELQRQAIGQAQKTFNDRIAQLGQVASTGLSAATTVGGIEAQRGLAGTELIGRTAAGAANIESQITQLTQSGAFAEADINTKAAEIERATGQDLATLAQNTGANVSQILQDLGSGSAELRSQAGRDLAAAISQSSAQLANLQAAQGAGVADIVGAQLGNISNLLLQEGLLEAGSQEQLATILANITVGQGSTAANIASNIGQIEAAGVLGTNTAVQTAIGGLIEILGQKKGEK